MSEQRLRVMAIDFGLARIGVALSDPTRTLASPLTVLHEKDKGQQIARVIRLAEEHEVAEFVVGIPFMLDGTTGEMAATAERYAAKLERVTGLPVHRRDERLTSVEAEGRLRALSGKRRRKRTYGRHGKALLDDVSATIILQDFLDEAPAPR